MKRTIALLASLALAATAAHAAATKASSLTSNYITWTFDKEYETGQFVNGDWYVVGPVKIVSITNALSDETFRQADIDYHGAMINPVLEGGQDRQPGESTRACNDRVNAHGYDSRVPHYQEELNAALPGGKPLSKDNPIQLKPDQSLISVVSWLWKNPEDREAGSPPVTAGPNFSRPTIRAAAVLTSLAKAPPAGTFRPSYAGNEKRLFNISQLKRDRLRNLAPVGTVHAGPADIEEFRRTRLPAGDKNKNAPPNTLPGAADETSLYWSYNYGANLAMLARATARPWIDHMSSWAGSSHLRPAINVPNYGRESNNILQTAMLALHLDWSKIPDAPATKDELLINLCQIGIDTAGCADAGSFWPPNGGHHAGRKPIILFAGLLLDDPHMKNVGHWKTYFQDDLQLLYITERQVEHTNSDAWKPDMRSKHLAPYTKEMIGMPEWVGNNAGWNMPYRGINIVYITGFALTFLIMEDGRKLWNRDVLFDYADRANGAIDEASKLWANRPPAFVQAMWDTYRKDYPSTYDKKWEDEKLIEIFLTTKEEWEERKK